MSKTPIRPDTRNTLLDAADRIVVCDGAATLTLDAVAREAGVSKGGVLYHFATKDALIGAMVERASARFEHDMRAHLEQFPPAPGRWTRAYLEASHAEEGWDADQTAAANAGLLAAVATNQRNLDPLRLRYASWQSQIEVDGIEPAIGTLVRLAIDGLWLADMLDLASPDAVTRSMVYALLRDLIERGKDASP